MRERRRRRRRAEASEGLEGQIDDPQGPADSSWCTASSSAMTTWKHAPAGRMRRMSSTYYFQPKQIYYFYELKPVTFYIPYICVFSGCYFLLNKTWIRSNRNRNLYIFCAFAPHSPTHWANAPNVPAYVENRNIWVKSTVPPEVFCHQETLSHLRHLHFTP